MFKVRREGVLIPRHAMWAGMVRGHLCVIETRDTELLRVTRVATIEQREPHAVVLGPLFDALLVSSSCAFEIRVRTKSPKRRRSRSNARTCHRSPLSASATGTKSRLEAPEVSDRYDTLTAHFGTHGSGQRR